MDEDSRVETTLEQFFKVYNIEEIKNALDIALKGAKDFGGYDFTEELKDELGLVR